MKRHPCGPLFVRKGVNGSSHKDPDLLGRRTVRMPPDFLFFGITRLPSALFPMIITPISRRIYEISIHYRARCRGKQLQNGYTFARLYPAGRTPAFTGGNRGRAGPLYKKVLSLYHISIRTHARGGRNRYGLPWPLYHTFGAVGGRNHKF